MNSRDSLLIDIQHELENTDFGNERDEDDSYQYIIETIRMKYEEADGFLSDKDCRTLIMLLDDDKKPLDECFMDCIEYLEGV